jgi:hypothetical protein
MPDPQKSTREDIAKELRLIRRTSLGAFRSACRLMDALGIEQTEEGGESGIQQTKVQNVQADR